LTFLKKNLIFYIHHKMCLFFGFLSGFPDLSGVDFRFFILRYLSIKMREFYKQITDFITDSTQTPNELVLQTQQLNRKQRFQIHQFCVNKNIHCKSRKSEDELGDDNKVMIITKGKDAIKFNNDSLAGIFINLTNLPLRCRSIVQINDHLQKIEPFYPGSIELFNIFMKEAIKHDLFQEVKRVVDTAAKFISEHSEVKKIKKKDPLNGWENPFRNKKPIYNTLNNEKHFVSFDIKQGNFNVIKQFCPTLFPGTWTEFISQFTNSKFISKTKNRRNYIFVSAGLHDLCVKICEYEIERLNQYLIKNKPELSHALFKCNDEIIFELGNLSEVEIYDINQIMADYDKKSLFHIDFFTLKEIPGTESFLKECVDGRKYIKSVRPRHLLKTIVMVNSMSNKENNKEIKVTKGKKKNKKETNKKRNKCGKGGKGRNR